MNTLPDSLPYNIKAAFLAYQRKEWERVLELSISNPTGENQFDSLQHWKSVNAYALSKIQEIDRQLEQLKINAALIANH